MKTNGNDIAIKLTDVSKRFKLYHNPITGPVKEILFFWNRKQYYDDFLAVNNVSMEIKRGEVVGIIGPNGAGKTTLLKMIAGLLPVDGGKIEINGKVTALLALGVGVHPEFTGKENILYGGMLLGMSKRDVLAKMDSIIEFAELGDYINHPFRTYSSGMKARLLFAISMSIDPDILIVDEALATGDSYFLSKSRKRILELCNSGATILFVSHNLSQIQELCSRVFFMAEGQAKAEGLPQQTIKSYYEWIFEKENQRLSGFDMTKTEELHFIRGTRQVLINSIKLLNHKNQESPTFLTGYPMRIEIVYQNHQPDQIKNVRFVCGFVTYKTNTYTGCIDTRGAIIANEQKIRQEFFIKLNRNGSIFIDLQPLLLINNHYILWIIFFANNQIICEYKTDNPIFVARENNPINIDAGTGVFIHPCNIQTN